MKKLLYYLLPLSLLLNIFLFGLLTHGIELPAAEAINDIREPGTYGPPTMEVVEKDFTINTVDVTLQNTLITGNLYINTNLDGVITLDRVQVQGQVVISSDSQLTLQLIDCSLVHLSIAEGEGIITIEAKGSTRIDKVDTASLTFLIEDQLENAPGFIDVTIKSVKKVSLRGDFESVEVPTTANIHVQQGRIAFVNIHSGGDNNELVLEKDVQIGKLATAAVMTLVGQGAVQVVDLKSPGLIILQGEIEELNIHTGGVFLELDGKVRKIHVPQLEHATSINLSEHTTIAEIELNGRTGITGHGTIELARILAEGVVIDQTPKKIVIPTGLTAIINGEEYRYIPAPEPKPEPITPTVALDAIGNVNLTTFGQTRTINISATPGSAISVSSNNTAVSVSQTGNSLTITGNRQGTATITVRAAKTGYNSRTRTFTVTVNPIKNVERRSMTALTHTVAVTLHDNNPSKYKVVLEGFGELQYDKMGDDEKFWAIVPAQHLNNRIIVTGRQAND